MGTYTEIIKIPYGTDEAARRIGEWTKTPGVKMKVKKKKDNFMKLKGKVGIPLVSSHSVTFELTLNADHIHAHCWVGGMIKNSIEPGFGWSGTHAKGKSWEQYQSLVGKLMEGTGIAAQERQLGQSTGVEPPTVESAPPRPTEVFDTSTASAACPDCGTSMLLTGGIVRPNGTVVCTNCMKSFKPDTE